MVLGIRERTGRSVTPKTDKTSVKGEAINPFLFSFFLLPLDLISLEREESLGSA